MHVGDRTRDAVDRPLSGDVSIIHSSVIETAFRLDEKMDRGAVNAHSEVAERTKNAECQRNGVVGSAEQFEAVC